MPDPALAPSIPLHPAIGYQVPATVIVVRRFGLTWTIRARLLDKSNASRGMRYWPLAVGGYSRHETFIRVGEIKRN